MKRVLFFLYGVFAYVGFLVVFAYLFGFIGNVAVPRSIDTPTGTPVAVAVAINLALLLVFGLQHSIMARPTFKEWWTRFVPAPIERSTYVLATNLVLALLFWQWRGLELKLWDVQWQPARAALLALFVIGWGVVFAATVLLNHFDLFGLRQVWLYLLGKPHTGLEFHTPLFYRWVRHPLYVGWLTAFWATPTMTAGHLLFSLSMTMYILIAIYFEERNLIEAHGHHYVEYRRRVPMLVPAWPRRRDSATRDDTTSQAA